MKLKCVFISLLMFGSLSIGQAQNQVVQNILNDVNIDSVTFFVQQLTGEEQIVIGGVADTIRSRHRDQPGNELAFQFVKQKFAGYGLQVDSMQFNPTGKNLLATLQGTDSQGGKYIVGAHYDNVGLTVFQGADDNASGSAAVVEAARVLCGQTFPYSIVFALWDEEEQGLLGSAAYAAEAAANSDTILGYINLDMLGWDGNNDRVIDLHVRAVANSMALGDRAMQVDSIYNIGNEFHIINPGSGNTDHASFWDNGFTTIGIDEEYDNDFNPYHHTTADSLGQFNLDFYERIVKLAIAILAQSALDGNGVLGIGDSDKESNNNITIYPNPAGKTLNVQLATTKSADLIVTMLNQQGQTLWQSQSNQNTGIEMDINGLPAGIYYILIEQDGEPIGQKKWMKL